MFKERKRIITGHNAQGRSVVTLDGPPGKIVGPGPGRLAEIWATAPGPVDSHSAEDLSLGEAALNPVAGGTKFRWFQIQPEDPSVPPEEAEKRAAEAFAAMGAAEDRVDTTRHPSMHKTKTIDYIILLSGQVKLLLDDDQRDLKPFDVVVQRGTNHAWVNTGTEPALLIAVLIDAEIKA